jgi:putative transposase
MCSFLPLCRGCTLKRRAVIKEHIANRIALDVHFKIEQRGGQVVKVGRFFPSSKTCHCCGWKWEDMQLSDRGFVCQNPACAHYQFKQDRDHNAALNILFEAFRLIGLIDKRVHGIGSDEDGNLAVDAG